MDADSDGDGLRDGEENRNGDELFNTNETNATDPDTDDDTLLDGADPDDPFSDADNDGSINANDTDSNADGTGDYPQTYATFRTNATDTSGDGKIDYGSGTWVAVDPDGANLTDLGANNLVLKGYKFNQSGLSSVTANEIMIYYGLSGDSVPVRTPVWYSANYDGYRALVKSGDVNTIYIELTASSYTEYIYDATIDSVAEKSNHSVSSYVRLRQETYDHRPAINDDTDFDGLTNVMENGNGTGVWDRDSDDDGVVDGKELKWSSDTDGDLKINALDPDADNDGITDGTELGITTGVYVFTGVSGTNLSATYGSNRTNFTADNDTSRTTDPLNSYSDGDTINDLFEFRNGANPDVSDTDGDLIPDNEEIYPSNGTQKSNPVGVEGQRPTINLLSVNRVYEWKSWNGVPYQVSMVEIKVKAEDNMRLDYVEITVTPKVGGIGERWRVNCGFREPVYVTVKFDAGYLIDYQAIIVAKDTNTNGRQMTVSISRALDISKAVVDLGKAILEAASKLLKWITSVVERLMQAVMKPFYDALHEFERDVATAMMFIMSNSNKLSEGLEKLMKIVTSGKFPLIILGISTGVNALETIAGGIQKFVPGIGSVIELVKTAILPALRKMAEQSIAKYGTALSVGLIAGILLPAHWATDLIIIGTTSLWAYVTLTIQAIVAAQRNIAWTKGDPDVVAMLKALIGLFLTVVSEVVKSVVSSAYGKDAGRVAGIAVKVVGFLIGFVGMVDAILETNTMSDKIGGLIGSLDELIDVVSFGYDAGQLYQDVSAYFKG